MPAVAPDLSVQSPVPVVSIIIPPVYIYLSTAWIYIAPRDLFLAICFADAGAGETTTPVIPRGPCTRRLRTASPLCLFLPHPRLQQHQHQSSSSVLPAEHPPRRCRQLPPAARCSLLLSAAPVPASAGPRAPVCASPHPSPASAHPPGLCSSEGGVVTRRREDLSPSPVPAGRKKHEGPDPGAEECKRHPCTPSWLCPPGSEGGGGCEGEGVRRVHCGSVSY